MADKGAVSAYKKTAQADYNAAINRIKQAYNAALKSSKAKANAEKKSIAKDYSQKRSEAYKNARISAIGNNEGLAAKGLAAGLYDTPISGASETSRIASANSLRNNLGALSRQETADKSKVDLEKLIAGYNAEEQMNRESADVYAKKAEQTAKENQFAANHALKNFDAYLAAYELQKRLQGKLK